MFNKKNLIIGAVMVLAVAGTAVIVVQRNKADVRSYVVERGSIQEYVELRGKVALDQKKKIYSKLAGIVESIKADEGDRVDANSELLRLDVKDLRIALDKADAAYQEAKSSLEELKNSIKPEQIRQASAQVEQAKTAVAEAQADYNYKKENLDKLRLLYEQDAVSEQDIKDAEVLVTAAQSALQVAEQQLNIARYNLDMLQKGVSEDAIQVAEARVRQAKLQLEELKNNILKAYVYAGIKGTVLTKYVEEGMAVQPGTPLYEIGDYASAYVKVDVLVDDAGKIKIGQKAVISGDILDDKEIQGEIYYIAPKAESGISSLGMEQQRIEMKIKYDAHIVNLKPGYGVDVDIITKEKKDALYVPDKAVFNVISRSLPSSIGGR